MTEPHTVDELLAISDEEREEYIQRAMKINNELIKRTERIAVLHNVITLLLGVIGIAVLFVGNMLFGVAFLVAAGLVKVFREVSLIRLDVSVLGQNLIIVEHQIFALVRRAMKTTEEK